MLSLIAVLVLGLGQADPDLEKLAPFLKKADEKMRAGDYEGAEQVLNSAVKTVPNHPYGYALRAEVTLALAKSPERVVSDVTRALELGLKGPQAEYYKRTRAWGYMGLLKHEEAFKDATDSLKTDPENPGGNLILAGISLRLGDGDLAIRASKTVLKQQPENFWALGIRGHAEFLKERYEEAISAFESMKKVAPTLPIPYSLIGIVRVAQGKEDEALAEFERGFREKSGMYAGLWIWKLRIQKGDKEGADQIAKAMLEAAPKTPVDLWHQSVGSYLAGKISQADLLKASEKGSPAQAAEHLTEAHFFIATKRAATGDKTGAIEFFKKARSGTPWAMEANMAERELVRLGE